MTSRVFIGSLFFLVACHGGSKHDPGPLDTGTPAKTRMIAPSGMPDSVTSQSAIRFDSALLDVFFRRHPASAACKKDVKEFYRQRKYAFAWYDAKGLTEQAGNLYNRFKNLSEEGLGGTIPYVTALDSLMETADAEDVRYRSRAEFLLTTAYFYFAEKVWTGLDESQTKKMEWYLPRKNANYSAWLQSYLQSTDGNATINEPVYRQYGLLRSFLKKYAAIAKNDPWKPIPLPKKSYRPGDTADALGDVKKRLYELGDLTPSETGPVFDVPLEQAVKQFQHRFGVKEDGIIGKGMMEELNHPVQDRILQIGVNMERSRWLPDSVKGPYLVINIPEFKLHMYQGDSLLWDMDVVVGKAVHKTVIFSGALQYVVFSPYWNVPTSILKSEVLPGIRRNPRYLALHHMEWNGQDVRQKPGPWNSLGRVKFLFPNRFNIYLHDTPAKSLFGEDRRAFSHGCIRLADPLKLAMYLLRNDPTWNEERVTTAMSSGKEQYVTLKEAFPVFITYLTAWVDRSGHLNFRRDIYGRDKRLETVMGKK